MAVQQDAQGATAVVDEFAQAVRNKDRKALDTLLAPDFTSQSRDGKSHDRAEWQAALEQEWQDADYHDVHYAVDKATTQGDTVVAYVTKRYSGQHKQGHHFHSTVHSRDVLKRVDGQWKIAHVDNFNHERRFDGRLAVQEVPQVHALMQGCGDTESPVLA